MKRKITLSIACLLSIVTLSISCNKNKDCNATAKGRIIGYDPCRIYNSTTGVKGAGFVLEIENGATKDTVVTYGIPEGKFDFQQSYVDPSYSSYLFRPEVQDKFKVKFNYRFVGPNEQSFVACNGMVNTADFYAAVRGRQAIISCISNR